MNDTTNAAADAPQDIYALFETVPEAESQGVWHNIGTSRFRIRALSSAPVQAVRVGQLRRQSKLLQANGGVLPAEIINANETELAGAVLTGWENVPSPPWWTDTRGLLSFTPEVVKRLMGEPKLRPLRDLILNRAGDTDNFRRAELERMEGNSSKPSDGPSKKENTPPA